MHPNSEQSRFEHVPLRERVNNSVRVVRPAQAPPKETASLGRFCKLSPAQCTIGGPPREMRQRLGTHS
jgi:hypothetical protein